MAEAQKDFQHIVRIVNTDLDGNKKISHALLKIKGVGFMMANVLCNCANVQHAKKAGVLSRAEVERLEKIISNPISAGIPSWLFNRRRDLETGEDMHVLGADLKFQHENDLKMMKKLKSYKGLRHSWGLPVRGQSTKSNFRNKAGKSLGVKRKKK